MRVARPRVVLTIFMGLALVGTALAAASGVLVGKNGHTVAPVFDTGDIRALSGWNLDGVWLGGGYPGNGAGQGVHSLATTSDGTLYAVVGGGDEGDDTSWVTGVVAYDPNATPSLKTLFQVPYGQETLDTDPLLAIGIAAFSNALVDEGDLLLLESVTDRTDASAVLNGLRVYAVTPGDIDTTDPAASVRLIFEEWRSTGFYHPDLLASADGTLFIVGMDHLSRLDYDTVDEEYVATSLLEKTVRNSLAIDADGMLYGQIDAVQGSSVTGKEIYEIDPSDGLFVKYATASNWPSKNAGLAFDTSDTFWLATYKANKSAAKRYYLASPNRKMKFPYKKRAAQWLDGMLTLHGGADGNLYAIMVETDDTLQSYERTASVWEIE